MEWCFETGGGAVTVRREGDRALFQAIRGSRGSGVYKAWLRGAGGRFLLGTLIPEGGALRLRRSVPVEQLEARGVWPPEGAEILMAAPLDRNGRPPEGFYREEKPWCLVGEPGLSQCLRGVGQCLVKRDEQGFLLALPFAPEAPFPLPSLFCLSRVAWLEERRYVLFRFDRQGRPVLPE